jgi:hypothetical protein
LSIKVMSMIWDRLDVSGGELALALAIGDFSDDDGESIFPSVARLAWKSRQDRRTVQRQLAKFRDVDWLQVITEGGLAGGRGRATEYRINPIWINGGILPLFTDLKPIQDEEEKGGKLSPFAPERAASTTLKGGIHDTKGRQSLPPHPSGSTNNLRGEGTRATPSGSRASPKPEPPPFNVDQRRVHWRRLAAQWVINECRPGCLGIMTKIPSRFVELPLNVRMLMPDKIEHLVNWAIEQERPPALKSYSVIENHMQAELTMELRQFKPPTPAERAAAAEIG